MEDEMNKLLQSDDEPSPNKKEKEPANAEQVRKFPSGQQIGQKKIVHDRSATGTDDSKKTNVSWAADAKAATSTKTSASTAPSMPAGKSHLRAFLASRGTTPSTSAGTPV